MTNVDFTELTRFVFGLSIAAIAYSSAFAAWVTLIRQPAWRRVLTRWCLLGMLALPILCWFAPLGRLDWQSWLGEIIANLGIFPPHVDPISYIGIEASLLLFQLGAVAVAIFLAAIGWLAARSIIRSTYAPDGETFDLYTCLTADSLKVPLLRVSDRVRRPILLGLWRPMIVLPGSLFEEGKHDKVKLALLHELAHARAGDYEFQIIAILARVIGVLIPPVWILQSQMRLDHEFLADLEAITRYGTNRSYARMLLEWAGGSPTCREHIDPAHVGNLAPQRSSLSDRIAMMIRCPFPIATRAPLWWTALAPIATIFGLFAASSLALAPESQTMSIEVASSTTPPRLKHQSYYLPSLTLGRVSARADGRVQPIQLPVPLSETFDLTMTVDTDQETIGRMRVAGYPIPTTQSTGVELVSGEVSPNLRKHVVRVQRTELEVTIWTDDVKLANHPVVPSLPTRLTIEPASDSLIRIDDLTVTW